MLPARVLHGVELLRRCRVHRVERFDLFCGADHERTDNGDVTAVDGGAHDDCADHGGADHRLPATTVPPTTVAPTTAPTSTATTPPANTPNATQSTNCVAAPHVCGFPDETNTGILPGTTMTQVTSSSTSGPGWHCRSNPCTQVIVDGAGGHTTIGSASTGLELADGIAMTVTAPNITIENLKVDGAHGADTWAVGVCGTDSVGYCPGGSAANNFTITTATSSARPTARRTCRRRCGPRTAAS